MQPLPPPAPHPNLGLSAGLASIAVALCLVLIKLWAVLQTGSLSVMASLADSAMDLLMSAGAAFAIVYAARPEDEDHAFGHSSAEDLTSLAQSLLITGSALFIAWNALMRIWTGESEVLGDQDLGIWVMVVSIVLTLGLVWWQGRVAKLTGNKVVAADRLHYLSDLIPSFGAILALWLSHAFGWGQVDTIVALLAAVVMLRGAWQIGKSAWDALMDRAADPDVINTIETMTREWPGVRAFHDLKTRTSGSRIFIHLHIELDGDLPLSEAHDIGAGLRRAILNTYPQSYVIIHKDIYGRG